MDAVLADLRTFLTKSDIHLGLTQANHLARPHVFDVPHLHFLWLLDRMSAQVGGVRIQRVLRGSTEPPEGNEARPSLLRYYRMPHGPVGLGFLEMRQLTADERRRALVRAINVLQKEGVARLRQWKINSDRVFSELFVELLQPLPPKEEDIE